MGNLLLQFGILQFIRFNVVAPAVHKVQVEFKNYRAEVFDENGNFLPEKWEAYSGKAFLCQMSVTTGWSQYVVLFVWTTAMLAEFRMSYYMARAISRTPRVRSAELMLVITDVKTSVVALTMSARLMLYLFVCTPKFLISSYLLFLGCQWLSAAHTCEDLVLNSVALEFVLTIDEMLFQAFMPHAYRRAVSDINFFVCSGIRSELTDNTGTRPMTAHADHDMSVWRSYMWSVAYLLGAVAFLVVYETLLQNELPPNISVLRGHCVPHLGRVEAPLCRGFAGLGARNS